ncbi:hypothetical protein INQ23_25615, partial [Escherichia coli]|nr:hypothetical protein [Escherichia coli]
ALRGIEEQRPVVWVGVEAVGSPEALEDAIRQRVAEVGLAPADQLSRMLDDGRACLVLDGVERLPDGRDFTEISPMGYVPAIETGAGFVLTEGPAVLTYIAELAPE